MDLHLDEQYVYIQFVCVYVHACVRVCGENSCDIEPVVGVR